ncbi:ribonuclease H-like domain-containing protein [Tanacetum coccineum]|uniref:Ribonuclease H-like domain-containing protein n=1 Tax=Tanacetum coccineum TaxID=301880 RepID=A0ABQ4XJ24_9ASTR
MYRSGYEHYHPQTYGQIEKIIQTLEDMLHACVIDYDLSSHHIPYVKLEEVLSDETLIILLDEIQIDDNLIPSRNLICKALGGNTRDLDSIWKENGQDCNFTRSGFKDARTVPGDGVTIPGDAIRTYKRKRQKICDSVIMLPPQRNHKKIWLAKTLKKGSPFRPDSETNKPPLRTYQLWKKTFDEEIHKLDDMTELPKSQPKKTYEEDLESEIVIVKMPSCMSFLGCTNAHDEPIGNLDKMGDGVENPSPQSTPQVLSSFEEYTPPVTYPKEVEETLRTPMEVEPLDQTKLEDVSLNNHIIPTSYMEVTIFEEPEPQPQPLDDPKKHYGFKLGLLGQGGSLGINLLNWEVIENNFLRGLNLPVKPNELEKVFLQEITNRIACRNFFQENECEFFTVSGDGVRIFPDDVTSPKLNVAIIKSSKDTGYGLESIVTHDGEKLPCWPLDALSSFKDNIVLEAYRKKMFDLAYKFETDNDEHKMISIIVKSITNRVEHNPMKNMVKNQEGDAVKNVVENQEGDAVKRK